MSEKTMAQEWRLSDEETELLQASMDRLMGGMTGEQVQAMLNDPAAKNLFGKQALVAMKLKGMSTEEILALDQDDLSPFTSAEWELIQRAIPNAKDPLKRHELEMALAHDPKMLAEFRSYVTKGQSNPGISPVVVRWIIALAIGAVVILLNQN